MAAEAAEEAGSGPPDFEGWLRKKGHINTALKRRFFAVRGRSVLYFKSKEDADRGAAPKGGGLVLAVHDWDGHPLGFAVELKEGGKLLNLEADTVEARDAARDAFEKATPMFRMASLQTGGEDGGPKKNKGVKAKLKKGIAAAKKKVGGAGVGDGSLGNPLVGGDSSSSESSSAVAAASDAFESACCPKLSLKQRVYGWAFCYGAAYILSFLAVDVFLGWDNALFAALYTVSKMMALGSALFFHGPKKQCGKMWAAKRALTTFVYLALMAAVLVLACVSPDDLLLILPLLMLECVVGFWYSLSFIPKGQEIFKAMFCRCL